MLKKHFEITRLYPVGRAIARIGMSADAASVMFMATGVAGGVFVSLKNITFNIIGAILIVISRLFDHAFTHISRTRVLSRRSKIINAVADVLAWGSVYSALVLSMMNKPLPFVRGHRWGLWVLPIAVISAVFGNLRQRVIAGYEKDAYLFFYKGRLFESSNQVENGGIASRIYCLYLRMMEMITPRLQRLMKELRGTAVTGDVCAEYAARGHRYMWLCHVLGSDARLIILGICVFLRVPDIYFIVELLIFTIMCSYMKVHCENAALGVLRAFNLPGSDMPKGKINVNYIFFAVGVIGLVVMLWQMEVDKLDWDSVLELIPIWLPTLLLLQLFIMCLHTIAYKVVLGADRKRVKFLKLLSITISGMAMNNITPIGMAGGEPYKILALKDDIGVTKASSSAITFTIMYTVTIVMLWFTGAAAYFYIFGFSGTILRTILMGLTLVLSAVLVGLFILYKQRGLAAAIMRALGKLPLAGKYVRRVSEKHARTIADMDADMYEFKRCARQFWLTLAIEYFVRLCEIMELFFLFRLLGVNVTYIDAAMAYGISSLMSNLIFFIPLQIGAREGAVALSLSWLGITSAGGVTAALLSRIRELIYTALGVALMLLNKNDEAEEILKSKMKNQ